MKVIKGTYSDKASDGDCLIVFECLEAKSSNCSKASKKQSATLAPSRGLPTRVLARDDGGGGGGRERARVGNVAIVRFQTIISLFDNLAFSIKQNLTII